MRRFELAQKQKLRGRPQVEGFIIPEEGVAAGPSGGIGADSVTVLVRIGWFNRKGSTVTGLTEAEAQEVTIGGEDYQEVWASGPKSFQEFLWALYPLVAQKLNLGPGYILD